MSARWAAGAVRARAIARRCAGTDVARDCAAASGLPEALGVVSGTAYGRRLHRDMDLRAAEYAIEATLVWNLRVLAGWQPRAGASLLRVAVCAFEAANIVGRLRELSGGDPGIPFELGALTTVWPRVRQAATPTAVRAALAASPWGDPRAEDPAPVAFFLRMSGARRLAALGPEAAKWAAGDAAVALGRERFLARRPAGPAAVRAATRLLGPAAVRAQAWEEYAQRLPHDARWVLDGVSSPEALWRAEAACLQRKETDSRELLRGGDLDAKPVLAAAMLLSVDAWRMCAALESAARSGRALEVFDAVA